ncbi:MAG: redoxin family protein [Gemmatimonadetes bacterium]|nr:redoxin family protein [Gemmatimonadota bacterium]
MRTVLVTGLLAGAVGIACSGTPVEEEAEVVSSEAIGTEIGHTAPNFEVYAMDGSKVTLEDFRGRPLFVNFWAWWCPPCIRDAEPFLLDSSPLPDYSPRTGGIQAGSSSGQAGSSFRRIGEKRSG